MYLQAHSRPDITFAVNDLARHVTNNNPVHHKAMKRVMAYCCQTPERGLYLKPTRTWDGSKQFLFRLRGRSDSDYATCKKTRRSTTGFVVYLEDAPIQVKTKTQQIVALSVCEAELIAMVQCAQALMQARNIMESMGLQVELPMTIECDNKGAVDLVNGFNVGNGTKHIQVRYLRMREWREDGTFKVRWVSTEENEADVCTKNTPAKIFLKHIKNFVGADTYQEAEETEGMSDIE